MSAPALTATPWFRRLLAASGVALLLLLTASTASPALHHWLHADSGDDASDNCAVTLFASGLTLAAAALTVAAPRLAWVEPAGVAATVLFLTAPRYLRQPERGPPGC